MNMLGNIANEILIEELIKNYSNKIKLLKQERKKIWAKEKPGNVNIVSVSITGEILGYLTLLNDLKSRLNSLKYE